MTDDDIDGVLKEKWIEILDPCNDELISRPIDNLSDIKSFEAEQNIAQILRYRGKLYFVMGRYEQALADFTKLLEFETNNTFALRYRAETYYMIRDYKRSLTDLYKLLKINANNTWASQAYEEVIRK